MDKIINELYKLSEKAYKNDDVPVGCIIIKDNKVIAKAYNKKVKNNDPTAHAEILCIKKAAKKLKTNNLNDCVLYSSLLPCKMCCEVIKEVRIKKIYYILDNDKINNNEIQCLKINIEDNKYLDFKRKIKQFFINKR